MCKHPGKQEPEIIKVSGGKLWLIDFRRNTVAEFNAPLSVFDDTVYKSPFGEEFRGTSVYKSKGVWIKVANDRPEYLAVVNEFAGLDRSVLNVYTPTGQLVYQEVLPENSQSLAISHPLASLMEIVGVLIEKYEDEHVPELTVE